MHWSSTSFVTEEAPHLKEYLSLIGNPSPFTAVDPIGPDDALLVVDMQNDLLLRDAVTNPDGGRFGAPEGEQCIGPIVRMIEHFVERGGHVIATRTYHPFDHASFYTEVTLALTLTRAARLTLTLNLTRSTTRPSTPRLG